MFNYDFDTTHLFTEMENIKEHGYNHQRFQLVMAYILQYTDFLEIVISRGQQDGKDFLQMVDHGKMAECLNIYNFLKNLHPHSLSKEANFDQSKATSEELNKCFNQFAFRLYNLICTKVKELIFKFTKQNDSLVTSDHIIAYEVYENQQEFFFNYFYQLIAGLFYKEGYKKSESKEELQKSLQWLSSNSDMPQLDRFINENKDLKEVQLELVTCISNLFNKFSHLKYVENQSNTDTAEPPKKPHQDDLLISQILDMGFNLKQAKKALKLEGGIEAAVTYLFEGDLSQLNTVLLTEDEEDIFDENFEDNDKPKLDETQIQLIVDMGVERKEARKALKFTGSVEAAIGLIFEGDKTLLNNVSDHEDEPEDLKKEKRQLARQKKIEERLAKEQKQKEKQLKRELLISTDQFYEFIDKIQRECFEITQEWYQDNKNTSKNQKYYLIKMNYLMNYLKIDILPKNTSQQQILKQLYETNYKLFQLQICELQQFKLFGGGEDDKDARLNLIEIEQIFQLLFKLQNIPLARQYFESIKQNHELNYQAFQNSIYSLLNTLLSGKHNMKPEDFFQVQLEILIGRDDELKVGFVFYSLSLIFRCLQMCRVFQQKYINKFQKTDKKIVDIQNLPEKDQNIILISKYQTKGYSYFREIQKISNQAWGEKIHSYSLAYIGHLKKFNFSTDDLNESKDLLLQLVDASQFIQAISDHVLTEFRQSPSLKDSNCMVIPSKFSQQINLDLETSEFVNPQQTRASGTLKILKIQIAILNPDRLIDQFAYIMKQQLTLKAKKQAKFRLQKDKQKNNFEVIQKDSEIDLQKFINDFRNTVLGIEKDNYGAYKSKPISDESARLFNEYMYQAIPQVCEIRIPTNKYEGNIDILNIMLKQEIVKKINSKNEKDVEHDNLKEIKLYENIMSQLVESGQFLLKKVELSWSEDILLFENIYNWSLMTMLALRSLSCIARTSFDGKSGLITKIQNDFKDNNKYSLLSWFKNIYLPIRLLGTHNFNVSNQEQNIQEVSVFLIADYNENLDKNICFFLNELLGYGHLYSESAILQRKVLRQQLLCSCLETLQECADGNTQELSKGMGYMQMPIIKQSQIIGSIMIVQYLINQYSIFEYNRVVQSRYCYQETIEFLLDWQSGNKTSSINLIYDLQEQVQWLTQLPYMKEATSILGKQTKFELLKKLNLITTQAFSSQLLDRISLILSQLNAHEAQLSDRQIILEKSVKKYQKNKTNESIQEANVQTNPSQQQLDNQGPAEVYQQSSSQQIEETNEQTNQNTEQQNQQPVEVQKVGHRLSQNIQAEQDDIIVNNENQDDNNDNYDDDNLLYDERGFVNEIEQRHIRVIAHCEINDKPDDTNRLTKGIYPKVYPQPQTYQSLNIVSNNQAYHIEYDILQHHISWPYDEASRYQQTIDNIKSQQTSIGEHNSVSHLLQILKPLTLQNFYDLGQIIEDRFVQIIAGIDNRKKEEKERNQSNKIGDYPEEEDNESKIRRHNNMYGYDLNDLRYYCDRYREYEVYGQEDRVRYQKETLERIETYAKYQGINGLGFRNLRNFFRKQSEDKAQENQDLDVSFCSDVSIYPKNEISNYDKIKNFIQSLIDQAKVSYEVIEEDQKVEVQPSQDQPEETQPSFDVMVEVQSLSDIPVEAQLPQDAPEEIQPPSDVMQEVQPISDVTTDVQPNIEIQPPSDNQITEQNVEIVPETDIDIGDLSASQPVSSPEQIIQPIQEEQNQIDSSVAISVARINGLIYIRDDCDGLADIFFSEPGLLEQLPVNSESDQEFPKNIQKDQDFPEFKNLPKRQSGSFISYTCPTWTTDDGQRFPEKKYFFETHYDSEKRKFSGWIDWTVEPYFDGGCFWQYSFNFSEDFQKVQSGYRVQRDKNGKITAVFEFGNQLNYTLQDLEQAQLPESSKSKDPESLDLPQLIASVKDPQLRREMLLELTQEEADDLPYDLKTELDRILGSQNPEQVQPSNSVQEEQEKSEDLVDPNTLNLDQFLIENLKDLDQLKEDESIQRKEKQNILQKLRNLKEGKNQDKLIRNILQNLLFQEFRNDTKNLITHLFSKKSDLNCQKNQGFKIKFMNSLIFLMQATSEMNKQYVSQFFELSSELEDSQLSKLSNQLWTRMFLKLSITLSRIIQEDPTLAVVLLVCFIQPEKDFYGKQDQLISNVAHLSQKDENQIQTNIFNPPFTTLMKIMLQDSIQQQKLEKIEKLDEAQQQSLKDAKLKSASIRITVRQVLKQFNLLYNNQGLNPKLGLNDSNLQKQAKEIQDKNENKKVSTFGLLSQESIHSLSNIGQLPSSNQKKMTQNLQKILFRTTQLSMLDLHLCNTVKQIPSSETLCPQSCDLQMDLSLEVSTSLFQEASNQAALACFQNFNLLIEKQVNLGLDNLTQMLDLIWQINEITGCHDEPKLQQLQSFTKFEKNLSINETLVSQISLQNKKNEIVKKMTDHERKELKDLITQFKSQSTPFIQVLSTFNFFIKQLVEQQLIYQKAHKSIAKQIEEKGKQKQRKTEELDKMIEQRTGNVGQKVKQIEQELDKIQKEEEESQKALGFVGLIIKLQAKQIKKLHEFYLNDELQDFVDQANQFLLATQKMTDEKEMIEDESKILFNIIFDSFYPEMLKEVINFKPNFKTTETESKFVKMEKIEKIQTEDRQTFTNPTDSISLLRKATSMLRPAVKNNQLLVFKNEITNVSPRLERFNAFCLQNKDLLNKYIKNNWSSGQHQDLDDVINLIKFMPNLLSFENKQTLFQKEIQKLRDKEYGYFEPEVRRTHLFEDTFQRFIFETPEKLKYNFKIRFENEPGIDAGGVRRDFFNQISKQIFNQNLGLFQNSDNGSTYMPNPRSALQFDYIKYFKFIGRIIAKAIYEKCMLECYFVSSIYKMIIGQTLNFKDLQDIDNNLYTGLNWCLLPSSDVEYLYETFSIDQDYFGQQKTIDIIERGSEIDLTNENKEYYVERKAYYLLYLQVQKQMDAFLEGFYDVIPKEIISIFTYKEIELLISGQPHYEISDLKANTEYKGYSAESPQIKWFWEVMETLNETDKASFLQFVTGSSKVPVGGFAMLNGMSGLQKFQISHICPNWKYQLPEAHTCYNQIDLPEYASKEMLEEKLMWAIKEASGFGFG